MPLRRKRNLTVVVVDALLILALYLVHRGLELCGCHLPDHASSINALRHADWTG